MIPVVEKLLQIDPFIKVLQKSIDRFLHIQFLIAFAALLGLILYKNMRFVVFILCFRYVVQ